MSTPSSQQQSSTLDLVVRSITMVNLALMGVSYGQWFSGTEDAPGFADRLFNHVRLSGWRFDVVWLVLLNVGLALLLVVTLSSLRQKSVQINSVLITLTLIVFGFYVHHLLFSGLLDMG